MHLYHRSKSYFESVSRCVPSDAADGPVTALENEERHHLARWPLASSFRFRAIRLRKDGVLRLCDWCLKDGRRCMDSRRSRNLQKSWKAFRRHQWAVEQQ